VRLINSVHLACSLLSGTAATGPVEHLLNETLASGALAGLAAAHVSHFLVASETSCDLEPPSNRHMWRQPFLPRKPAPRWGSAEISPSKALMVALVVLKNTHTCPFRVLRRNPGRYLSPLPLELAIELLASDPSLEDDDPKPPTLKPIVSRTLSENVMEAGAPTLGHPITRRMENPPRCRSTSICARNTWFHIQFRFDLQDAILADEQTPTK